MRVGGGEPAMLLAARWVLDLSTARQHQRPIVIHTRPVTPTRTVHRPWHTPIIDTDSDLAAMLHLSIEHLDWYADRRAMNRRAMNRRAMNQRAMNRRATAHRLHHYHYRWTDHGRLIEAPNSRLRALFRTAGFPEPVAHTLTGLCTARTPHPVLRRAPADLAHRATRLATLRTGHLPQGAPTSPALANLCAYRLDLSLTGLADVITCTRYADDLAFSGDLTTRRISDLIAAVTDIARDEGFQVHPAKTRVRGQADRQLLAGLVVNQHPATPRDEYDQLRAILHNAARTGLAMQNRTGHPDVAQYLIGRITWVSHQHPARAAKLATLLAQALAAT